MRVVYMGTPGFAVPPLEHLVRNQYPVVAVYTRPDKLAGRGRSLAPSAVKMAALAGKLPVLQPESLKGGGVVAQLAAFRPDVIVVAAYGQILPPPVLDLPRYGCINIHPSRLPRWRGPSPVTAAILAGDEFTGVSIMLMDPGLDTGPVLARAQIPIAAADTTGSLTAKLSLVAAHLLREVLVLWPRGEITPKAQGEAGATYSRLISKEEGEIDWQLPAVDIWRRVRAFQPWPGAYTSWRGRRLEIIEAVPLPEEAALGIGRVVARGPVAPRAEAAFGIGTGAGVLGVSRLQAGGKKAMTAAEFLRGQRQFIGAVLPLR